MTFTTSLDTEEEIKHIVKPMQSGFEVANMIRQVSRKIGVVLQRCRASQQWKAAHLNHRSFGYK